MTGSGSKEAGSAPAGDRVPDTDEGKEELVEETIDESFPASDPPSYWGRETTDDAGHGENDR